MSPRPGAGSAAGAGLVRGRCGAEQSSGTSSHLSEGAGRGSPARRSVNQDAPGQRREAPQPAGGEAAAVGETATLPGGLDPVVRAELCAAEAVRRDQQAGLARGTDFGFAGGAWGAGPRHPGSRGHPPPRSLWPEQPCGAARCVCVCGRAAGPPDPHPAQSGVRGRPYPRPGPRRLRRSLRGRAALLPPAGRLGNRPRPPRSPFKGEGAGGGWAGGGGLGSRCGTSAHHSPLPAPRPCPDKSLGRARRDGKGSPQAPTVRRARRPLRTSPASRARGSGWSRRRPEGRALGPSQDPVPSSRVDRAVCAPGVSRCSALGLSRKQHLRRAGLGSAGTDSGPGEAPRKRMRQDFESSLFAEQNLPFSQPPLPSCPLGRFPLSSSSSLASGPPSFLHLCFDQIKILLGLNISHLHLSEKHLRFPSLPRPSTEVVVTGCGRRKEQGRAGTLRPRTGSPSFLGLWVSG